VPENSESHYTSVLLGSLSKRKHNKNATSVLMHGGTVTTLIIVLRSGKFCKPAVV
jgi:hypothetical protein